MRYVHPNGEADQFIVKDPNVAARICSLLRQTVKPAVFDDEKVRLLAEGDGLTQPVWVDQKGVVLTGGVSKRLDAKAFQQVKLLMVRISSPARVSARH